MLGLLTAAAEGDIPDAGASIVDLSFLGILPNATHEWAETLNKSILTAATGSNRQAANALPTLWQRVVVLVQLRAEIMQAAIKTVPVLQ